MCPCKVKRTPESYISAFKSICLCWLLTSVKASKKLDEESVIHRLEREKEFCEAEGWGWQLYTERQVEPVVVANAKQLLSWANTSAADGLETKRMATAMERSRADEELGKILSRSAKESEISNCRASAVFSHAVLRGELQIDKLSPLALRRPLILARIGQ